jgi:hypothetical protein
MLSMVMKKKRKSFGHLTAVEGEDKLGLVHAAGEEDMN